jgi:UDP-glucose 4-epimerase
MLKALTKTGVFTRAQGSDHCFNFIHVRDVAFATERALVAPGPFAPLAYNISSGECWRLGDVAALVRPMFPAGRLQIGPGRTPSSTSKGRSRARQAQRDLGYEPEWTLARGLADYAAWLKTHEAWRRRLKRSVCQRDDGRGP